MATMLASQAAADCSADDAIEVWDGYFLNDEEDYEQNDCHDNAIQTSHEEKDRVRNQGYDITLGSDFNVGESHCMGNGEDENPRQATSGGVTQTSQNGETLDQHQSILFTLPYEIRALIWTSVVGGGLVHITELRNTLGHVACMDRESQKWGMWQHDCWNCSLVVYGIYVAPESYGKPEDRWVRPGSLGLLRSCRRLYADAINVLYEQNTFCMRSLGTLHRFLDSLTPERLGHVTSLYLSPLIHANYWVWEDTWATLARVPNLKSLRVELRGKLKEREPWAKSRLLQAMCCIEQTEVYEVKVPWELEETKEWIWACPFSLEGTYGEVIESGEKEYLAHLRRERVDIRRWIVPGPKRSN